MTKISRSRNQNWRNNSIQFPRLIEEAEAAGAWTKEVIEAMAVSMDLTPRQVRALLKRAMVAWEKIKDLTPAGR